MGLIEQIEACREKIIQYVGYFLCYQEEDYMNLIQPLLGALEETLTKVVMVYEDPRMQEYKQDQEYWPSQLERVICALQSRDRFLVIDALENELSANLLELEDLLKQKGIAG